MIPSPAYSIVLVPVGKAECCHLSRLCSRQVRQKGILSHADGHSWWAPRPIRAPAETPPDFPLAHPRKPALQQRLGTCEKKRGTLCCARLDAEQNLVIPNRPSSPRSVCEKSTTVCCSQRCAICYAVILLFDGSENHFQAF
jgi:hypothetical protein